ncbi:MAG: 4,5-DOPA dioxygenase extradiol [Bacteroidota bacterium]|nr:4,5-DOPA dioxygenase extradiol [Bacteroidota bacterium]
MRIPLIFVGHGTPMNALEVNEFTEGWKEVVKDIPRPAGILCISAHWETEVSRVTTLEKPPTIHDFGGFPSRLYEVSYPAPGSPFLAKEVQNLTGAKPDPSRGLDHGTWSVLIHMFPEADIPVVQMSIAFDQPPQYHLDLAKKLIPLRDKGILILGSGNIVHNLRKIDWDNPGGGYEWALRADEILKDRIRKEDTGMLVNYQKLGPDVMWAVPTPEHFLPMIYILGAKRENEKLSFFNEKVVMGSLSMTGIRID